MTNVCASLTVLSLDRRPQLSDWPTWLSTMMYQVRPLIGPTGSPRQIWVLFLFFIVAVWPDRCGRFIYKKRPHLVSSACIARSAWAGKNGRSTGYDWHASLLPLLNRVFLSSMLFQLIIMVFPAVEKQVQFWSKISRLLSIDWLSLESEVDRQQAKTSRT